MFSSEHDINSYSGGLYVGLQHKQLSRYKKKVQLKQYDFFNHKSGLVSVRGCCAHLKLRTFIQRNSRMRESRLRSKLLTITFEPLWHIGSRLKHPVWRSESGWGPTFFAETKRRGKKRDLGIWGLQCLDESGELEGLKIRKRVEYDKWLAIFSVFCARRFNRSLSDVAGWKCLPQTRMFREMKEVPQVKSQVSLPGCNSHFYH